MKSNYKTTKLNEKDSIRLIGTSVLVNSKMFNIQEHIRDGDLPNTFALIVWNPNSGATIKYMKFDDKQIQYLNEFGVQQSIERFIELYANIKSN